MKASESDKQLIARAAAGAEDAFGELVRRYQHLVTGVALHILGPRGEIDDVVQETFIDVYRGLATVDPSRPFGNWLRAVARHRCLRELSRRDRWPRPLLAEARARRGGADGRAGVMEEVDRLPAPQREALVLHYIDGYSQKDIASFIGRPEGTVRRLIHEARRTLRKEHDSMARKSIAARRPRRSTSRRSIRELMRRARALAAAGEVTQAADAYERVLTSDPSHVGARVEKGLMYWQARSDAKAEDRALREFRRAVKEHPDSFEALIELAHACEKTGRRKQAVAAYSKAIEKWPEREADVLAEQLYAMDGVRPFAEVEAFYRGAARRHPDHPRLIYYKGWATYCAGKVKEAVKLLKRAAELDPTTPALNNLATIYWDELKDAGKAVYYMRESARFDACWLSQMNLAWTCRAAWELHPDRDEWCREALDVTLTFLTARVRFDDVLLQDERAARMVANILAPLRNNSPDAAARERWLRAVMRRFQAALADHPRRPWLRLALAELALARGDEQVAEASVRGLVRSAGGRKVLAAYETKTPFVGRLPEALREHAEAALAR